MTESYKLEKTIWNDSDFDKMGWHDVIIYGIAFGLDDLDMSLDIDYIFKWVQPIEGDEHFQFWICPCTLVFQNVSDLRLEADPWWVPMMSIDEITRTDPHKPKNDEYTDKDMDWLWTVGCQQGEITFRAVGFVQYVRRVPMLMQSQTLGLETRGGISFDRSFDGP
jgi:hypothetical protein